MKRFYVLIIALMAFSFANAQTNVSGGIYSNTTWTKANSPYIVTDTVVVFPGVTLTIQPGVTVKFNNNIRLEIRQATLIAIGTTIDSIKFTSNSSTPSPGVWNSIFINHVGYVNSYSKFDFCSFRYAKYGIFGGYYCDSILIKNSTFEYNQNGVYADSWGITMSSIDSCTFRYNTNYGLRLWWNVIIDHSLIIHNQYGAYLWEDCKLKNSIIENNSGYGLYVYQYGDSITNNRIRFNGIGIQHINGGSSANYTRNLIESNNIGIKLEGSVKFKCNKICNNTTYNLYYNASFGNNADNISNNYWCTKDSVLIAAKIYDGYDNINLGLVNFMPIDTSHCYLTGCLLNVSATVTNATCDTCHNGSATAHVTNGTPPYTYTWYTSPLQTTQTATGLSPGTYTVCVLDGMGCSACNYNIYVDSTNCTGFSAIAQGTNATCSTCNDGSASVSIIGGTPPYSYTWYTNPMQTTNTATGLLPGTYGVCVTDHYGCIVCDSVSISAGNCSAHFNLYPDSIQLHQYYAVNMASGTSPLHYLWQWGDNTTDTIAYPTHTYANPGFYAICLTITDAVGCTNNYCNSYYLQKSTNTMVTITVIPQTIVGNTEYLSDNLVSIYPNPATNTITIDGITNAATAMVYDISGKLLIEKELTAHQLDISNLSKGLYFIRLTTTQGSVVKKFVKE